MTADLDAGIRAAIQLFRTDIARYEDDVRRAVTVPLAPHEVDALVSFHYNTGGIAEAVLTRHLNAGDRKAAAAAFLNWKRPAAIIPRRTAERDLFAHGRYPEGTDPGLGRRSGGQGGFRGTGPADQRGGAARDAGPEGARAFACAGSAAAIRRIVGGPTAASPGHRGSEGWCQQRQPPQPLRDDPTSTDPDPRRRRALLALALPSSHRKGPVMTWTSPAGLSI